jgi:hypothetical protein
MSTFTYTIAVLALVLGVGSVTVVLLSVARRARGRKAAKELVSEVIGVLAGEIGTSRDEIREFAYRDARDPLLRNLVDVVGGRAQREPALLRSTFLHGDPRGRRGIGGVSLDAFASDPELQRDVLGALRLLAVLRAGNLGPGPE